MSISLFLRRAIPYEPYYDDGEGGEGGDGGITTGSEGVNEGNESSEEEENGEWDGRFTPDQQKAIDKLINTRFAKERTEKESLIKQLNSLKESSKLTKNERDDLQRQIDQLETSLMTKEEQAAKAKLALEQKHQKDLQKATEQSELWQSRFTDSTIERALTDAAVGNDAMNPTQFRLMFRSSTRLVEDTEEATGKALGTFTPHMRFIGLNDEDQEVEMDMPVKEAVKKLKEDGLNSNLFKHGATGGTGRPPASGQGKGKGDPSQMPTPDQFANMDEYGKAYQKWRDEYNLDGTKKRKRENSGV